MTEGLCGEQRRRLEPPGRSEQLLILPRPMPVMSCVTTSKISREARPQGLRSGRKARPRDCADLTAGSSPEAGQLCSRGLPRPCCSSQVDTLVARTPLLSALSFTGWRDSGPPEVGGGQRRWSWSEMQEVAHGF